ncbi:LOW QUALITY PROTEIN: hypothetical protein HID58_006566, partial [Brassica napus]
APHVGSIHATVNRIWASPKGGTKIDVQFIEKKHGPVSNRKQSYEGKGVPNAIFSHKGLKCLTTSAWKFVKLHPHTERCTRLDIVRVMAEVNLHEPLVEKTEFKDNNGIKVAGVSILQRSAEAEVVSDEGLVVDLAVKNGCSADSGSRSYGARRKCSASYRITLTSREQTVQLEGVTSPRLTISEPITESFIDSEESGWGLVSDQGSASNLYRDGGLNIDVLPSRFSSLLEMDEDDDEVLEDAINEVKETEEGELIGDKATRPKQENGRGRRAAGANSHKSAKKTIVRAKDLKFGGNFFSWNMHGINMPCKQRAVHIWIQAEHLLFGSLIETRERSDKVVVTKLHMSDQVSGTGEQFFCSAIFGYNTAFDRLHLWRDLRATHAAYAHLNLPWILMGDVNVTLMSNEHFRAQANYRDLHNRTKHANEELCDCHNKALLDPNPETFAREAEASARWQKLARIESLVFTGFKWGTIILFFHQVVQTRSTRNTIRSPTTEQGSVLTSAVDIKKEAVSHFQRFLKSQDSSRE